MFHYVCEICHGEFESENTTESATQEGEKIWGKQDEWAIVCDDCWVKYDLANWMPDA